MMGKTLLSAIASRSDARPGADAKGGLSLSRRTFIAGLPLALAACTTTRGFVEGPAPTFEWQKLTPQQLYAPLKDGDYVIPAVDLKKIKPEFYRQVVRYRTDQKPGTIVIDPQAHFLYLVQPGGWAIRYGIGVGRQGFAWHGDAIIRYRQQWPVWRPPAEMIDREPRLEKYRNGMPGGLDNPLGARALYLYQGWVDTLYRIHGTNKPWTIGTSVSSGCIRMINQDVVDLYSRVPLNTRVVVLGAAVPDQQATRPGKSSKPAATKTAAAASPAAKPAAN